MATFDLSAKNLAVLKIKRHTVLACTNFRSQPMAVNSANPKIAQNAAITENLLQSWFQNSLLVFAASPNVLLSIAEPLAANQQKSKNHTKRDNEFCPVI